MPMDKKWDKCNKKTMMLISFILIEIKYFTGQEVVAAHHMVTMVE